MAQNSAKETLRTEGLGRGEVSGGSGRRVGILTFHSCINYGSYWQARCLTEGIRALGYDAVLLNHRSRSVDVAEWRCALRPTLPTPVPKGDVSQYACKVRQFLAGLQRLPQSSPIDIDHPEAMEEMETVVIGSDEVWNLRHPWYAGKAAFFGVGLRAKRVVAYAASFGNYSSWEGLGEPWTGFLRRFHSISVRDENSWWMLKNSLGADVPVVLDPCLQFPCAAPEHWSGPARPFALVYGHGFSREFSSRVKKWAQERGLLLLSVGYRNDWAELQWLSAGPGDFVEAVRRAEAIATNFFHGCVFALANAKSFACERSEYRSIKVGGLMELVGGEAHLIQDSPVDRALGEPIAPAILSRIAELRVESEKYLALALANDHER